jgi:hypothetical protein
MIFDNTLLFSDAQAITADAASTNIVDLGNTGTPYGGRKLVADIGKGIKIPLFAFVTASFNNLTSLAISIQCDDNEAFSSPKEVGTRTYALAFLTAGRELPFPEELMEGIDERYVRLFYDVTGTAPTTGAITAGVVAARQTNFARHF